MCSYILVFLLFKVYNKKRSFCGIQKVTMVKGYTRIKILSEAEINDLYSLPKFTSEERVVFFSLNTKEKQLIQKISDFPSKVYTILQLGYFKAKGRLYSFKYEDVFLDIDYVLIRYFSIEENHKNLLVKAKKVENNKKILTLLKFRAFDKEAKKGIHSAPWLNYQGQKILKWIFTVLFPGQVQGNYPF